MTDNLGPIAFNLINDIDVPETEARVTQYRKDNAALIELNIQREEQYAQYLKDQEDADRQEREQRAEELRRLEEQEREEAEKWANQRSETGKDQDEPSWHSAGWKWFLQVQQHTLAMSFVPPKLYDLQITYVRFPPLSLGPCLIIQFSWCLSMCGEHAAPRCRGTVQATD